MLRSAPRKRERDGSGWSDLMRFDMCCKHVRILTDVILE